jgi:predicted HNH restriction endonuclease
MPLGSPKAKKTTVLSDLVTVRDNCHRMLHTREGMTVSKLKQAMTGSWPDQA